MDNRANVAKVVSQATYINCPPEIILARLQGKYDYGDGRVEQDPNYMIFSDRECNYPLKTLRLLVAFTVPPMGHGERGSGLCGHQQEGASPGYLSRRHEGHGRHSRRRKDMEPVKFFDGTFDPNQAEKYALSFAIHSRA